MTKKDVLYTFHISGAFDGFSRDFRGILEMLQGCSWGFRGAAVQFQWISGEIQGIPGEFQ